MHGPARRTALVHDFLVATRGAERVFEALCELFPDADVFTGVYDERGTEGRFSHRRVTATYLQRLRPSARTFRALLPLYPHAIEALDLSGYDLVLSSSSAWAHGVRPAPGAIHVCYCHNPFRYAWNGLEATLAGRDPVSRAVLGRLFDRWRRWDVKASRRVTRYVANSHVTRDRVQRCFGRVAPVVYPPVAVHRFAPRPVGEHYVALSELMPHKRLDVAVAAFNRLREPLVVIGDGPDARRLQRLAGPTVTFAGRVSDERVAELLARARALVVPAAEEFGIAAVEAQAAGRPVIALRAGGLRETVLEGETGAFFEAPDPGVLADTVRGFDALAVDPARCVENARRFAPERFAEGIRAVVDEATGAAHADGRNGHAAERLRLSLGVRRLALPAARVALLAGPAALAFATGGYPDVPRAWAGLVAWLLAAAGLALGTPPRGRAVWLALGGGAAFAGWTLLSVAWAPVAGPAWDAAQVALLYLGALVAAATLLGDERARRAVEPALAAGALAVVGYGLSERLLPGLLSFDRSVTAEGRLEQPLTYWNAMGVVAAMGLVLVMRLAADPSRSRALRAAAAAAAAPLGLGLFLTVSRGALFAAVAGVLALVVATGRREQLQAVLLAVAAAGLASLVAAPFDGVTALADPSAGEGAVVLAGLLAVMGLAATAAVALEPRAPLRPLPLPRRAGTLALVLVAAGFALALAAGTDERAETPLTPGTDRLTTLSSNRYEYWKVAGRAFADQPVRGVGGGGWAVRWRRERPFAESARDAHSLYFQTAAELGLVGLLALAATFAGVVLAARRARAVAPEAAAGPIAVCAVWAAHVALDWDFTLPAATLPAVVCAGALLAATAPRPRAAPRA